MKARVVTLAAAVRVSCASMAVADTCSDLAITFAQAGSAMKESDLTVLGRCVMEQIKRNKQAERDAALTAP